MVAKAGSNDNMSSGLLCQSCYIHVYFLISHFDADVRPAASAVQTSLASAPPAPLFMAEAALGWSARSVGPETSPGDRMKTG